MSLRDRLRDLFTVESHAREDVIIGDPMPIWMETIAPIASQATCTFWSGGIDYHPSPDPIHIEPEIVDPDPEMEPFKEIDAAPVNRPLRSIDV